MRLVVTCLVENGELQDFVYASPDQSYVIWDQKEDQGYYWVSSPEGSCHRLSLDECRRFIEYVVGEEVTFQREDEISEDIYSLPVVQGPLVSVPKSQKGVEATFYSKGKEEPKKRKREARKLRYEYEGPFKEARKLLKRRPYLSLSQALQEVLNNGTEEAR